MVSCSTASSSWEWTPSEVIPLFCVFLRISSVLVLPSSFVLLVHRRLAWWEYWAGGRCNSSSKCRPTASIDASHVLVLEDSEVPKSSWQRWCDDFSHNSGDCQSDDFFPRRLECLERKRFFSLFSIFLKLDALSRSHNDIVAQVRSREHILVLFLNIAFNLGLFRVRSELLLSPVRKEFLDIINQGLSTHSSVASGGTESIALGLTDVSSGYSEPPVGITSEVVVRRGHREDVVSDELTFLHQIPNTYHHLHRTCLLSRSLWEKHW